MELKLYYRASVGKSYNLLAIKGAGEHLATLLDVLGLHTDPKGNCVVFGAEQQPVDHRYDHLLWTRFKGGTLFETRYLPQDIMNLDVLRELARRTACEVMYIQDPSSVVAEAIVVVNALGKVVRHVYNAEGGPCFANGPAIIGEESELRRYHPEDSPDEPGVSYDFEYAEGSPSRALAQFLGFCGYAWSHREPPTGDMPERMNATRLATRRHRVPAEQLREPNEIFLPLSPDADSE